MIKIYSTKTCAYCHMVEKYLTSKGLKYKKIMIDDDMVKQKQLFDITGATTVPITEYKGQYVVGWNVKKLNELIQN